MSPLRQNPTIAARKTNIRVWKSEPTESKYRHAKISETVTRKAMSEANPAESGSIEKQMPTAIPFLENPTRRTNRLLS